MREVRISVRERLATRVHFFFFVTSVVVCVVRSQRHSVALQRDEPLDPHAAQSGRRDDIVPPDVHLERVGPRALTSDAASDPWSPPDPTRVPGNASSAWGPLEPTRVPGANDPDARSWEPSKPTTTVLFESSSQPASEQWKPTDPTKTPRSQVYVRNDQGPSWRPVDPTTAPGSLHVIELDRWRPSQPTRLPTSAYQEWQPADPTTTPELALGEAAQLVWSPSKPTDPPDELWEPSLPTRLPSDSDNDDNKWRPLKPTRVPGYGLPYADRWNPELPTLPPGLERDTSWRPANPTRTPRDVVVAATLSPNPTLQPNVTQPLSLLQFTKRTCVGRCWSPPPNAGRATRNGETELRNLWLSLVLLCLSLWW